MLYKFKSKATGDLIMLQPHGRRMLEIIGKIALTDAPDQGAQGILLPEDMPPAVESLQAAIHKEEANRAAAIAAALARNEAPPRFEGISLRQRAAPLIEMLHRCAKAKVEMVWGV